MSEHETSKPERPLSIPTVSIIVRRNRAGGYSWELRINSDEANKAIKDLQKLDSAIRLYLLGASSPMLPIDPDELPWRSHKNGEGQWISSEEAPELANAIKAKDGRLIYRGYRYRLSRDGRYINRWPIGSR